MQAERAQPEACVREPIRDGAIGDGRVSLQDVLALARGTSRPRLSTSEEFTTRIAKGREILHRTLTPEASV